MMWTPSKRKRLIPKGRVKAIWAMGNIGAEQAIQALIDLGLHDNHWRVRTDAISELGRHRINEALPAFTNLLSDKNPGIRRLCPLRFPGTTQVPHK
ncbi:MAG: hypothetical protein GWN55_12725 [Phycisphaerae bacterium]|nr:HEAT repeat domain-containing protein [Phycisphaerae bacterium]NIS50001.1 HEAT repeat domain-containing protein [Phycisphaerae bacterium]NIU10256.1 HEAT repeat domain-containing protein [Phycisphaerae bacterium]NIV02159.1 hypothetical protein [Phycisphaerae bacterium]NIW91733.1 hypothetical protein [Phycisphaerae bacterium]